MDYEVQRQIMQKASPGLNLEHVIIEDWFGIDDVLQ